MVHAIGGREWERLYGGVFDRLFTTCDPFAAPLGASLPARALLFPVPYALPHAEAQGVISAARGVGDQQMVASPVEEFRGSTRDTRTHYIADLEVEAFAELVERLGLIEYALYSPAGRWALLFSHEDHVLVGGPEQFIRQLQHEVPSMRRAPRRFLETWIVYSERRGVDTSWVPGLLSHLGLNPTGEGSLVKLHSELVKID